MPHLQKGSFGFLSSKKTCDLPKSCIWNFVIFTFKNIILSDGGWLLESWSTWRLFGIKTLLKIAKRLLEIQWKKWLHLCVSSSLAPEKPNDPILGSVPEIGLSLCKHKNWIWSLREDFTERSHFPDIDFHNSVLETSFRGADTQTFACECVWMCVCVCVCCVH